MGEVAVEKEGRGELEPDVEAVSNKDKVGGEVYVVGRHGR